MAGRRRQARHQQPYDVRHDDADDDQRLEPSDSGGKHANFIDVTIDACTAAAGDLRSFAEVKRRRDSGDLFRANHAVPFAAGAG